MKMSENINEISKAVSTAQGEMNPASKSTVNPFFKSTYSNLTQVWEAIREPLSKNSISVFQDVVSTQVGISVTTLLSHSSGQWMEFGPLEISLTKRDAQSIGSATSYAKRYALSAAVGVVSSEDDDGEAAMARESSPAQKKYEQKKSSAQVVTEEPNVKQIYISEDQGKYLSSLLSTCSQEYQDSVWKFLNDVAKVTSYDDMQVKVYEKVLQRTKGELDKGKQNE